MKTLTYNPKISILFFTTGIALVLHILTGISISLFLVLLVGCFVVLTKSQVLALPDYKSIASNVRIGVISGASGLLVYDTSRLLLYSTNVVETHPFEAFNIFGLGIIGTEYSGALTLSAGVIFHVLNGILFAIAFTFAIKKLDWKSGLLAGLGLELAMLAFYPKWLGISNMADFTLMSVIGHSGYGLAVGGVAKGLNRDRLMEEMKNKLWVTRKILKVDRLACIWLIRKFIDSNAKFKFVYDEQIESYTNDGHFTFDAAGAKFKHDLAPDGSKYGERCSFQVLVDEFGLADEHPALNYMGKVMYAADIGHRLGEFEPREGYGLWMIANSFADAAISDYERIEQLLPIYEHLYTFYSKQANLG